MRSRASGVSASAGDGAVGEAQAEGRSLYRPSTYQDMVEDASAALRRALEIADRAGEREGQGRDRGGGVASSRWLEIQMPSLPGGLEMEQRGSSDDFQAANIRLAMAAAKRLDRGRYKDVAIVMPDEGEKKFYGKQMQTALDYIPGLRLEALTDVNGDGIGSFFSSMFGGADESKSKRKADIYFFVNASTVELPMLERFIDEIVGEGTPAVAFNLELDTLRSDLGLFGFPPKALHYTFLSQFLPVYYIRQRDYSKTIAEPPFVCNYSGMLFREYPAPWQVMLKQSDGSFACVAEDSNRFTLFDVKEELANAAGLNMESEGSTMAFLRRGYKRATWWEEDLADEKSNLWRS